MSKLSNDKHQVGLGFFVFMNSKQENNSTDFSVSILVYLGTPSGAPTLTHTVLPCHFDPLETNPLLSKQFPLKHS